ncbi:MAG: hypothetical protein JXA06_07730 [Bacteroidetes bacterium]|nr:hypothetical protein [Bacteroidota bacterium]
MKELISSVIITSLMLTLVGSAMPNDQSNSVKMRDEEMKQVVAGECKPTTAAILIIGAAWVAGAGVAIASGGVATGGVVVGVYALSTALLGAGVGCGGSGDKEDSKPSHYRFERVN